MSKINTFVIPIIRPDNLERMLFTLYRYTERDSFNVIVIDQTMTREAQDKCEKYVHLWIRPYRNLGFAKAMNTGIVLSQTDYITLANDDIEYLSPLWWKGIVDTFKMDKRIIAVNPMSPKESSHGYGLTAENKNTWVPPIEYVKDPDDPDYVLSKKPDGTGLRYQTEFSSTDYDFLLTNHPRYKPGTVVDAICMFHTTFTKEGLEEIGLLDERYFPGSGEDYSMDCRAYSCAWPIDREVCDPKWHKRMVSTSKSWVWHKWHKSVKLSSSFNNSFYKSRPTWNNGDELWKPKLEIWGHYDDPVTGEKKPVRRVKPIHIEEL